MTEDQTAQSDSKRSARPLLLLDLETTHTGEAARLPGRAEIIEIGAIWVAAQGQILATFRSFVRPADRHKLSAVCRERTGIKQSEIDSAERFPAVAARLSLFVHQHAGEGAYWATWGTTGPRCITQECDFHRIGDPVRLPHINAKQMFAKNQQRKAEVGLRMACKLAGVGEIPGGHCRALNDAMAISWMLPWVFGEQSIRQE